MSDPRDALPPGLHASIERNTQALTRAFSAVLPAAVKALAPPSRGRTPTAPPRPAHEGEHTMSTPTEPNMQIIENASSKDVRPGDHITWERVEEFGGATIYERREGIACSGPPSGKWFTEAGVCLTDVAGEDFTVTIRRAAQELPTEDDAAIVPAGDGPIEAVSLGVKFTTRHAAYDAISGAWVGLWRESGEDVCNFVMFDDDITPGTWKVGNR